MDGVCVLSSWLDGLCVCVVKLVRWTVCDGECGWCVCVVKMVR